MLKSKFFIRDMTLEANTFFSTDNSLVASINEESTPRHSSTTTNSAEAKGVSLWRHGCTHCFTFSMHPLQHMKCSVPPCIHVLHRLALTVPELTVPAAPGSAQVYPLHRAIRILGRQKYSQSNKNIRETKNIVRICHIIKYSIYNWNQIFIYNSEKHINFFFL